MNDIVTVLNDPEKVYPDNFDTPQRANAFLFGLCQEAAEEIKKLRAERERFIEVLRQLHDSYSLASDSNAIKSRG